MTPWMGKKERVVGSLAERFAASTMPIPECGCLVWIKSLDRGGYPLITIDGKSYRAHRVSYKMAKGDIPDGHYLDHVCRVRSCVNPSHLRAVTPRVNSIENSIGPTAVNAAKTHCNNGHPLSGENLKIERNGDRTCRICRRHSSESFRARRRQG